MFRASVQTIKITRRIVHKLKTVFIFLNFGKLVGQHYAFPLSVSGDTGVKLSTPHGRETLIAYSKNLLAHQERTYGN